jgi:hypothetical protein
MSQAEALSYVDELRNLASGIRSVNFIAALAVAIVDGAAALVGALMALGMASAAAAAVAPYLIAAAALATALGIPLALIIERWASQIDLYADTIEAVANADENGVIIVWDCAFKADCTVKIIGRSTGNGKLIGISKPSASFLVPWQEMRGRYGSIWEAGRACTRNGDNPEPGNYYKGDDRLCRN